LLVSLASRGEQVRAEHVARRLQPAARSASPAGGAADRAGAGPAGPLRAGSAGAARNAQNFDITKVEVGTTSTTGTMASHSGQPSACVQTATVPRLIASPASEIVANRTNCGPCSAGRRKVRRLLPK
jgi:hypothetical protein